MPLTPEQRSEQARKAAASRKTIANQHTATKKEHFPDTSQRDKVRAELLAQRLELHAKGKLDLSQSQVAAAKILIDKGKPSLQAVEQTNIEPALARTESEIIESLNKIIDANPDILTQLIAIRARSEASKPVDATQHAELSDKAA